MKTHLYIKLLCVSLLLAATACKKESKEFTTVNFHLYNPATNEGFEGVKVAVLREKGVSNSAAEPIWEGTTDAYGRASHSFKAYNSTKYFYYQWVDDDFRKKSGYDLEHWTTQNIKKNEVNEVKCMLLKESVSSVLWYKNVSCVDENDDFEVRYRDYWFWTDAYDEAEGWQEWSDWGEGHTGCFENIYGPAISTQYHRQRQVRVFRNGELDSTITYDYTITGENGTDTIKIFY